MKVALIIIYNHKYDKNIPILETIYKDRFEHIYHLVPFYNGNKLNVISVYENSHYFHGYVAQGFNSFYEESFDHYYFISDDLILNPLINQNNYAEHLKLDKNTSYFPEFINLHEGGYWEKKKEAVKYNIRLRGVEVSNELPSKEEALKKIKTFGLEIKPLKHRQVYTKKLSAKEWLRQMKKEPFYPVSYHLKHIKSKIIKETYNLPYPMIGGYSDTFVISAKYIKKFVHFCGVFSATELFVEIALPTAMILASDKIVTEKDLNLRGEALWTKEQFKILEKYNQKLKNLLEDFPENRIYIHPIKLSKWDVKL